MQWSQVEAKIRANIIPGSKGVLKCDGVGRRPVISNTAKRIGMRTGVNTQNTKAITYEMLEHAFRVLQSRGRYDSSDFRSRFAREYKAAPCRYSMTGGVFVELGIAKIVRNGGEGDCYYIKI